MNTRAKSNALKKRPKNVQLLRYGLVAVAVPAESARVVESRISGMLAYRMRQFSSLDMAIKMALIDAYSQGVCDGAQVVMEKAA